MEVGVNARRSRRVPLRKKWCANMSGCCHCCIRNCVDIPGGKAGLSLTGVKGPGQEETCNFRHVSLKHRSVGSMRGCFLRAGGMCLGNSQGVIRSGEGDNESSSLTQSL